MKILKEGVLPLRIIQFKNRFAWLIISIVFFLVWSGTLIEIFDYFSLVSLHRTGRSNAPNLFTFVFFFLLSCIGYLWRYTVPDSIFKHQKSDFQKPKLTIIGHIFFSMLTILLFSMSLALNWYSLGHLEQ